MTRDHEAEQVAMTMRADRLLDAIVDGRALTPHDELVFMLERQHIQGQMPERIAAALAQAVEANAAA